MSNDGPNLSADPELLAGFFDETRDQLSTISDQIVSLEANPSSLPTIESIFRTAHSIKGNAAFFGFLRAKGLAHRLENLLDALRKDKIKADREICSILLEGFDRLSAIFERVRSGGMEITDQADYDAMLDRIGVQEGRVGGGAKTVDWEMVRKDVDLAEAAFTLLPDDVRASVQALLRHLRALDPGASSTHAAAVVVTSGPLAELEAILGPIFEGQLDAERTVRVKELLDQVAAAASCDVSRALAVEMLDGFNTFTEAMGFDPMLREFLRERLAKVPTVSGFASLLPPPAEVPKEEESVKAEGTTKVASNAANSGKTMRVSESKIDTFLHYVGELLVVGDMFDHLQGRAGAIADASRPNSHRLARDLRRANETFGELSNKLQQAIMGIRKVPIKPLVQKVPRIVRDAAQAKEKECVVVIEGEDVEIDKSLVDLLDAPLTHMSRNAADHGVEKPDEREQAGKPRVGTIIVRAQETSSSIVLTIEDDGGGMNLERIRQKAEQMGILISGAVMTDQDIMACIFAPGLSTAETVTDISGRGVGMDVVKRAIEDAGGQIQIWTEKGKGTRFTITLPKRVTTQILPGYLLRLRGQLFVVPLDRVRETFRITGEEITSIAGRGQCLMRHGDVLPLLGLADALGLESREDHSRRTVVTLDSRRRRVAVEVDQVVGVQKVVIRDIVGLPTTNALLSGGALMGDGGVALILNVDALIGEGV